MTAGEETEKGADDVEAGSGYEAMEVHTSTEKGAASMSDKWEGWREWMARPFRGGVPRRYKLVTEKNVRKHSMWTVQFAVLCSAISTKMLNPNYPIMVSPGIHSDSFPNTDPFNFNSATYFIPMMSLLGVAISSTIVGKLSDRIGRKKPMLVMAIVSGFGNIAKYYARQTFWGFCIANLAFGFFLGNLPVAMAYAGDVYTSKVEKERQLGILVGNFVMGNSGGGIIAILMKESGLFAPLWVGAGLMFVAAALIVFYLIEPGDARMLPLGKDLLVDEEEDEERPEKINSFAMWNVIGGALADNFGSTGLFPLCLSPLALEQYFKDFVEVNEEPIMTIVGYQWLSVCVALMVIPSTMVTPHLFARIGASGTCVFGNLCTAVLTMALLFIGNGPATRAAFAGFVTVLYCGFPFTVFSQLTTGPMLDVLAPEDKVGFVQGLNNSAMNFGMAIAPWLFGILADATSTNTAIWTGIGVSFGAALINVPLIWRPEMGPVKKKPPPEKRVLSGDDDELASKALNGEYVPADVLFDLNRKRALDGNPFIVPSVKPYEEDKDSLDELSAIAEEDFRFRKDLQDHVIAELSDPNSDMETSDLCQLLNTGIECNHDVVTEHTANLGQWIGDYLLDNGYHPHVQSVLIKQMVMLAFPSITHDKEYTPENVKEALVRRRRIMGKYLEVTEDKKYSLLKIVGSGGRPQFYS